MAATFHGSRSASHIGRRPTFGQTCSMKTLVQDGILQCGEKVLTLEHEGTKFHGDLQRDGTIMMRDQNNQPHIYATPVAWANHCCKLANPESRQSLNAWSAIRFRGKRLDSYKLKWYRAQKKPNLPGGDGNMVDGVDMNLQNNSSNSMNNSIIRNYQQNNHNQGGSSGNNGRLGIQNSITSYFPQYENPLKNKRLIKSVLISNNMDNDCKRLVAKSLDQSVDPCLMTQQLNNIIKVNNNNINNNNDNNSENKNNLNDEELPNNNEVNGDELPKTNEATNVEPSKEIEPDDEEPQINNGPNDEEPQNSNEPNNEDVPNNNDEDLPNNEVNNQDHEINNDVKVKSENNTKKHTSNYCTTLMTTVINYEELGTRGPHNTHNLNTMIKSTPFSAIDRIQPFNVTVSTNALLLVDFHSHLVPGEVAGYLAGSWDPSNHNLTVTQAFPCRTNLVDESSAASVEEEIRLDIEKRSLTLVGWYHSHQGKYSNHPTIRDIQNQMEYQIAMKESASGYTPCIGLICSPHDARTEDDLSPSFQIYWVMPPPEQMSNYYGRPMQMYYSVTRDSFLTQDLLLEMRLLANYYQKCESGMVDFNSAYGYNDRFTNLEKLIGSIKPKLPKDLQESEYPDEPGIWRSAIDHFWKFLTNLVTG